MLKEKRIGVIQFEFGEASCLARTFIRDFSAILNGYQLYRLLPKSLLPIHDNVPIETELFGYQNIIAIPSN